MGEMKKTSLLVAASLLALLTACSSESDPGESCNSPGGTKDVCVSGTVCGKPSDKATQIVCIPICGADSDCPKDYECKGVDGTSIKGCRLKT
jgi:hypothetical protein